MREKFTLEKCIEECNRRGFEFIGEYKKKHDGHIIQYICNNHRDKGMQEATWSHLREKNGCPYCNGRYKTTEEIQREVKDKNVILISEYKGNEKPIKCRCKVCGNEWSTMTKVLTTNGSGCPKCGRQKANEHEMKSHDEFVRDLKKANPNIKVLEKYRGTKKKILCECLIDGYQWYGYPSNLLNRSAGCYYCNTSEGEKLMLKTLDDLGIDYSHQHSIDGCKLKKKLKFDAFNTENNIAFEYNGQQHYYPVDFAGKGEEWAKEAHSITKERDEVKRTFCSENGITVIDIPYWERDNMKEYIKQQLIKKGFSSIVA